MVKKLPANAGDIKDASSTPGLEDLEEGKATHSSNAAWKITWIEEPGGTRRLK